MSLAEGLSAAQVLGTGTVVSIGSVTGAQSETYVVIAEVKDGKNSGFTTSLATATNFASLGVARKVAAITDLGSITFTANRISNDPGQNAVNAGQLARVPYDFKMQLPANAEIGQVVAGDVVTFSGIITEAGSFDISIDKVSEYTFKIELNSWSIVSGS
jgi:hypothetical protein